jgi:hypothetical protein
MTGIILLLLALTFLAIVLAISAHYQLRAVKGRLSDMLGGTEPESIESKITGYTKLVNKVDRRLDELEAEHKRLSVTNALASQKISIVRFNPFGDTGGDQSFSLAVLDAHDSGYVLTSIHGRQGTRVYVKPIDLAKSKYTLSAEELKALNQAIKRVPSFD